MKAARKILNNAGAPLYLSVVFFSILKDYLLIPVISKVWAWTLATTPDGYVSNANIGTALCKSPWIVLIGIILLGVYLFFSVWQAAAIVIGVAYTCEGKKIRVRDMLKTSFSNTCHSAKPKNWMLLVYIIIVLPLTNIFQASEYIGAFAIPEYIQDYINSNLFLHAVNVILLFAAAYFALRWFYLLPAFFLKGLDYKKAGKESFSYTKKKTLKTGVKFTAYGLIESLRLGIVPAAIILLACVVAYSFVNKQPYAYEVLSSFILDSAVRAIGSVCSVMIYLSAMCYVVNEYYCRCKENGTHQEIALPEYPGKVKKQMSGRKVIVSTSLLSALGLVLMYYLLLFAMNVSPELVENMFVNPVVVAHKGYSSIAPENTMDAFELADQNENTNVIELDVWSAKDGIPVVVHNETIKAATGVDGFVYDYTYEELQQMPASYSMSAEDFPDARIPSLEEVIATYADSTPLLIEIKGYKKDAELPAKIVALMEKYNCVDSSMIHSGDYAALRAVKLCNPQIKCGLIQAIVTGNCYDLPYADFLSVEHSFVTSQMVKQLHNRGKEVYVWTINRNDYISNLKALNVDGYITDYPDTVANNLRVSSYPLENRLKMDGYDPSEAQEEFAEGEY